MPFTATVMFKVFILTCVIAGLTVTICNCFGKVFLVVDCNCAIFINSRVTEQPLTLQLRHDL